LYIGDLSAGLRRFLADGTRVAVLASASVVRCSGDRLGLADLDRRCGVSLLPAIGADAPLDQVEASLLALRESGAEHLVAIGGGSTLDAAKVLSVFAGGGDVRRVFAGADNLPTHKIPLVAVPTTAGSGAETSFGAILFDEVSGIKGGLRGSILQPSHAVVDPTLYLSAPSSLLAECGFDALTHAIETGVSKAANAMSRYHSAAAIRVLLEKLPQVVEKRCPLAMEQVAMASLMMGANLANSTTCLPHRIQYALRQSCALSHAKGLMVLYRGWTAAWRRQPGVTSFDELAAMLGYSRTGLLDRVDELKQRLGLVARLSDFGLNESDLAAIAARVSGKLDQDPLYMGREIILDILRDSL